MHYGAIKPFDIANGPGVRVSLFVSGCTNHCEECFQPETWSFSYGKPFDEAAKEEVLKALSSPYIRGLSLLGGEPLEPNNQRELLPFLKEVKALYPSKDIWCYTGNRLEEILGKTLEGRTLQEGEILDDGDPRPARPGYLHTEVSEELLSLVDVLVDGRFVNRLKDITLQFRGSSNQRLIDMPKTLAEGKIVWWENVTSRRPVTGQKKF